MLGPLSGGGSGRGCFDRWKRDVLHVSLLETALPKDNMALAWLTRRQLHVPDLQKECEVVKLGCSGGGLEREATLVDR